MMREKQMKDLIEGAKEMTEATKHLAKMNDVHPQIVEHLRREKQYSDVAQGYTAQTTPATNDRYEMAGILKRPASQQRRMIG